MHNTPEKRRAYHRQYHARNPSSKLRQNYGIDAVDYAVMLAKQGGRCAICRDVMEVGKHRHPKQICVDHDHGKQKGDPGFVRGLLCRNCNSGLGLLQDNPLVLAAAITYLEKQR